MILRISATIPGELVAAADARAEDLDRSRSWIISEALRRYLDGEVLAKESLTGLDASRLTQLQADLRLTPEERVMEAERTLREVTLGRPAAGNYLRLFDSFEEYLEWKRSEALR